MTDARFPERWLNDRRVLRLTDAGFRLFVASLTWSVSNRTDGVLYDDDLPLIPRVERGCAVELVNAGLWEQDSDRWLIVDFLSTQTTRNELDRLESVRRAEREKKARRRARDKSEGDSPPAESPGTVPADCTGQARPGKDRPGQAGDNGTNDEPDGWSEVPHSPTDLPDDSWSDGTWSALATGYDR